jgi:hypothetical protein
LTLASLIRRRESKERGCKLQADLSMSCKRNKRQKEIMMAKKAKKADKKAGKKVK